jgi:hypothetical protein
MIYGNLVSVNNSYLGLEELMVVKQLVENKAMVLVLILVLSLFQDE